jgi:hypothetical protein
MTRIDILVTSAFIAGCAEHANSADTQTAPDGVLFPDASRFDTSVEDTPFDTSAAEAPQDVSDLQQSDETAAVPDAVGPDTDDTYSPDATSDGSLSTCGTEQLTLSPEIAPPGIMLVVDRSGSMYDRWPGAIAAVESLVTQVGPTMRLGLALYPEAAGCGVSERPVVPLGAASSASILAALRSAGTGGSTPMGRAMRSVRDDLEATPQPGAVHVVLIADGKPSDTCLEDCEGCDCIDNDTCSVCADLIACTQREVSKHVAALAGRGTRTWVIGYAGGFGAGTFLESLAEIGGTANEGPSPFFDAGEGEALGQILTDIASTVETCTARVTEPAGYGFPVVTLSGATLPRDPTHSNGWDWVDGETIRLYGAACDAASQVGAELAITFICKQR